MNRSDATLIIMVLGLIIGLVYHVMDDLKWRSQQQKKRRRKHD